LELSHFDLFLQLHWEWRPVRVSVMSETCATPNDSACALPASAFLRTAAKHGPLSLSSWLGEEEGRSVVGGEEGYAGWGIWEV